MKRTNQNKIKRKASATWVAIISTLAAMAGSYFSRKNTVSPVLFDDAKPCGAGAANTLFGNLPVYEPSGFNIPSWKDQPLLPPGNIPQIQMPKTKYTGPNQLHYYEQPEFVKDYFKNLNTNLPRNKYEKNCGYVAATMLLSYYDTYWNPNFIPNQFNNQDLTVLDSLDDKEFDSPGVKDIYEEVWDDCEPMDYPDENSSQDYKDAFFGHYYNYIQKMLGHQNESFVAYLYKKAIELGLFNPEEYPIPLSFIKDISAIANQYVSEQPELSGKVTMKYVRYQELDGSSEKEKREKLEQMAAERLKKGQPIIFGGDLKTGGGHICIAYDYLENNRRRFFIVHTGCKGTGANRVDSYYLFDNFNDFAYLDVSPELQTIPNNPRFQVNGAAYSCHDLSSFIHKEKAICYEDETYHAIQSSDRDLRYEKHNFVYISSDTKRCTVCGKTISTPSWSN